MTASVGSRGGTGHSGRTVSVANETRRVKVTGDDGTSGTLTRRSLY